MTFLRQLFGGIGSFLQTPHGVILTTNAVFHGVLWWLGVDYKNPFILGAAVLILVVDFYAAGLIADKLVYFYSQFVLPVQTPQDRQEIFSRVNGFTGSRGPILFVKNGRVIKHEGETDKKGPGVIVLDTASAVVMQTSTQIVGPAGPGIRFTKPPEKITRGEGVDLRAQWQFIGPLVSEQPFLNPAPSSDPKKYHELRRHQTAGHTRDGFEIAPTISIKFRIKRPIHTDVPSESGVISQYGYDAASVLNAVSREVIELGTSENKRNRMEWHRLPAHLVVNLWREYVRKFKLEDLFTAEGASGLQVIEGIIKQRLTKPEVSGMTDNGTLTNAAEDSLEFRQLEELGLEIMDVRIHNIVFDPAIEEQIIKNWNAEWTKIAKREEDQLNERETLIETAAHNDALKTFARIASQKFTDATIPTQDIFTTIQNLIEPIREKILLDGRASKQMDDEIKKLDDIGKWLLVNKQDTLQNRKEGK